MCKKTNPVVFGCCFEEYQRIFNLTAFRGAQGAIWVANISQIFDGLVLPLKVAKIKHPFGILQSKAQIQQDLIGFFFYLKTCFDGTA